MAVMTTLITNRQMNAYTTVSLTALPTPLGPPLTVKGGPKGVGNAVNETVVYAFICLFVINVVMTAIGVKISAK